MKQFIGMMASAMMAASAWAQTTVTFKPGPSAGEDAMVFTLDNNCVPSDPSYTTTPAVVNYGTDPELVITRWTWNAWGCGEGTIRSFIRFNQLSTIPSGATIISAKLRLYTPATTVNWGNNYYPGTPLPNTNPGWVKRVEPGAGNPSSANNWNESTITWNSALGIAIDPVSANWATIPVSGSRHSWAVPDIDVTGMVQSIVSEQATDPYANNGFLLQLQTEVYYRQQVYASSDHSDATLWPELEVTYVSCNADFGYCSNSTSPYSYTFTANDPSQMAFDWTVNGNPAGNTPSITYNFPMAGSYKVCLRAVTQGGEECDRCINLCISDNDRAAMKVAVPAGEGQVLRARLLTGDDPSGMSEAGVITPNPAKTGWNIRLNAAEKGAVTLTVYDMSGRVPHSAQQAVTKGNNVIYQDAASFAKGIYFLEVNGQGVHIREKAAKD